MIFRITEREIPMYRNGTVGLHDLSARGGNFIFGKKFPKKADGKLRAFRSGWAKRREACHVEE